MGEPGAWFWPQAIADYQFGATGRFKLGANAGFRWHSQGGDTQFAANQLEEGQFRNGNLLTGQVGFAWRALDALDLVGETYATYLLDDASASKQKFSQEYIGGIKLFDQIYATTGGGPANSTHNLSTLIYRYAFSSNQFAFASALAVVLTILVSIFAFAQFSLLRRAEKRTS